VTELDPGPERTRQALADERARIAVALGVAVRGVDEVAAAIEEASMIRFASSGSEPQPHSLPKVIAPRQSGLTRRPEWPIVT